MKSQVCLTFQRRKVRACGWSRVLRGSGDTSARSHAHTNDPHHRLVLGAAAHLLLISPAVITGREERVSRGGSWAGRDSSKRLSRSNPQKRPTRKTTVLPTSGAQKRSIWRERVPPPFKTHTAARSWIVSGSGWDRTQGGHLLARARQHPGDDEWEWPDTRSLPDFGGEKKLRRQIEATAAV